MQMESFYFLHLFLFANKKIYKSELGEIGSPFGGNNIPKISKDCIKGQPREMCYIHKTHGKLTIAQVRPPCPFLLILDLFLQCSENGGSGRHQKNSKVTDISSALVRSRCLCHHIWWWLSSCCAVWSLMKLREKTN